MIVMRHRRATGIRGRRCAPAKSARTRGQYLGILKQAKTVKDTVEVTDKLDEVRGEIEQQQAEFEALSKQVETWLLP
jgi:hypothetical protein